MKWQTKETKWNDNQMKLQKTIEMTEKQNEMKWIKLNQNKTKLSEMTVFEKEWNEVMTLKINVWFLCRLCNNGLS